MADDKKIIIELTTSTTTTTTTTQTQSGDDLADILSMIQHPIKTLEKNVFGKNLIAYEAYQQVKRDVKSNALYVAHKYFNLTENYKAEQALENVESVISGVVGIGATIIGGAVMGAKAGGGYGAIAGAIIGAGHAVVNTATNAIKAWDRQHQQLTTMNIQSSFQQARLGLIDNGRGTLN